MKKSITIILTAFLIMACGNNTQKTTSLQDKPWQEIAPTEIELNPIQMIDKDWLEVSAGKKGNMNLMTISWGTIGELWGRPVFTVFVSTNRYTHKFMEENDYFTVTHFPESMRDKLSYLGRVSGRDEDKVAGAGLTVEFTELGNPIYAEADLAIECKKIYGQQFDPALMPQEQRDWYDRSGLGVHLHWRDRPCMEKIVPEKVKVAIRPKNDDHPRLRALPDFSPINSAKVRKRKRL